MTCEEIMTPSPTCCSPDHIVVDAAELMQREDVGLVPVVDERLVEARRRASPIATSR